MALSTSTAPEANVPGNSDPATPVAASVTDASSTSTSGTNSGNSSNSDPASPTILTPSESIDSDDEDSDEEEPEPALGTPLSLLDARLERGFAPHFDITTQRALKPLQCAQVSAAAPWLCALVAWRAGPEKGRANAAAILDTAAPRTVMEWGTGKMVPRFVADYQTTSGRVFDRLLNMEIQRLVPWNANGATGLIFDALHGGVRRMQIQDARRWADTERLEKYDEDMECTLDERAARSFYVPVMEEAHADFLYMPGEGAHMKCEILDVDEEDRVVAVGRCEAM